MTHSNQQIVDALYEALNGLTIGWQLANVKDEQKRTELQAPIVAGQNAVLALLKDFEGSASGATVILTPTEHEKAEWSRMAQAAYAIDRNDIGHRYSAAASLPKRAPISPAVFDVLQADYRRWLISNEWPVL